MKINPNERVKFLRLCRIKTEPKIQYVKIRFTIEDICRIISQIIGISIEDLHSKSRKTEIVIYRQIAQYFAYNYVTNCKSEIGRKIGNKDHATVDHSIKSVNNILDSKKPIEKYKTIMDIESYLNN